MGSWEVGSGISCRVLLVVLRFGEFIFYINKEGVPEMRVDTWWR
jgi:hypothetical protein